MILPKDFKVTTCRIPENMRSTALYYYEIRHDSDDWGKPISIESKVVCNFWGTLTTIEPLPDFNEKEFIILLNKKTSNKLIKALESKVKEVRKR